jgi:hypothetical protein
MGLFVIVLAFVVLVCCWWMGDMEGRSKLIITLLYLASWALAFINGWFLIGVQALFALIVGTMTFGPDWGKR